jgi:antibiotic biosynthesis monooxygenase (ABM) superfamily enzyme
MSITLAVVARIPPEGVADFQAYEQAVLRLLSRYEGRLERRLRNDHGTLEVHVVSFASEAAFEAYRRDPEREAASALLARSRAVVEVTSVRDAD